MMLREHFRQALSSTTTFALRRAALACLLIATGASAQTTPNIVIINIDDMGAGDFSVYGSQYSYTPNIDQLASQGTRFTQFYAGAPLCSPSRASLLTGQYAARSGINSFLDNSASNFNRDNADSLSLDAPSMPEAFHNAGYATGHFGKWHLGGGRDVGYETSPTPSTNVTAPRVAEYGYDQVWTQFEGLGNRIINVADYGGNAAGVTTRPSAYYNGLNQSSAELGTGGGQDQLVYLEREYNATFMIDRAIEFFGATKQADPNQPVFMNVWFDEVHTPHDPPAALKAKYDALYPTLPAESRNYLAMLEATDAQIGRLVDYIDQQGLGQDTLILVTADNGAVSVNVNNIGSAGGPLRGSKGDLFEGGFREPLIARWTGTVAANRVDNDTVMSQTDLFPTLTSITGVDPSTSQAFDGEDMSTALLGVATQERTNPLFWNMNRGDENRHINPDPNGAGANGQEVVALRSGDWKLLLNARGTSPELYNLAADPGETNNLARQQPTITSDLASQALAIRYSTPSRNLPDAVDAVVQLKAENLAALGNGAAVSSWNDAATGDSFNGNVSQSNASARPTLHTEALNGKAVVSFDGNDSLVSSATNSLPAVGAGVTVFAVTTADTSGDTAERLMQLGDSKGVAGEIVALDVSSTATTASNGGAGLRYNNGASLYDTPLKSPGFHIVAWQVEPGQTYAEARMYVDGTLAANTFTGSSTNPSGSTSFSGADLELILGTGRAAGGSLLTTDQFSGQLAELLVFNEQLDVGQINLVANYLSSEYGLPFAYQTELDVFAVNGLAWVGASAAFDAGWNAGDGAGGPASSNTNPFASGDANLFLGGNGVAVYNASVSTSFGNRINSLRVGGASAGLVVAGAEGNGTLIAGDAVNLTIGTGAAPAGDPDTGDLIVGEDGFNGSVTWNSTGLLKVEGKLRVGQGGAGTFEQNAGVVTAGDVAGTLKYVAIGSDAGSNGVYRLNAGQFLPGGGLSAVNLRHLRVGYNGAEGTLEVGDGSGVAASALVATPDDLYVGYDGGTGVLRLRSDGRVQLVGDGAPVYIGLNAGSQGDVEQTGGAFDSDGLFVIGEGAGASGAYHISGGALSTARDGAGTLAVGRSGGQGVLHVEGTATVTHKDALVLADGAAGTTGRLELAGSAASFRTARLENRDQGASEAIRWTADAMGVTPLTVTGASAAQDVRLQNPTELAANTGVNGGGALRGDGVALELDLAALTSTQSLTLINNLTNEAVVGYFEVAATGKLYEEGQSVVGSGFVGSVTITYTGGDGNDVVLHLTAGIAGDYNNDGLVDAADYTVWRDNLGASADSIPNRSSELQTSPVSVADFEVWKQHYGQSLSSSNLQTSNAVPEPTSLLLVTFAALATQGWKSVPSEGERR